MPRHFHGIGTINYGRRDFRGDGSFVTTEWFIWCFVPISPVVSRRIAYENHDRPYAQFDKNEGYWMYETTAANRNQVICTYAFVAGFVLPFILFANWQEPLSRLVGSEDILAAIFLAVLVCLPMLPYLLRRRAISRLIRRLERERIGLGPEYR